MSKEQIEWALEFNEQMINNKMHRNDYNTIHLLIHRRVQLTMLLNNLN